MKLLALAIAGLLAANAFAATKQDLQGFRKQIEATLHVVEPLPHPEGKSYGKFSPALGITAERVSFATDYSLRVPAIVYHGAGATITKHPALIIVNGHGGDKSALYDYWAGILYARAGAIVLTYDPIGEYERNAERRSFTSQHDQMIPPEDMAQRLAGLMITDVMQAVSYLADRPDVDPKRIAVAGFSMGSFVSSLACAIDMRVHACVLTGGGDLDGPGGHWDSVKRKMCEATPYQSLRILGDRPAVIFALNAKRGPTLIWNGAADQVAEIPTHGQAFFEDLRARTIAEAGTAKDVFAFGFTPNAGHNPYFLTKPVALWLEDKLKFPDWTRKDIEGMPETRVIDWAQIKGLQTPSTLMDEQLPGGMMALGNDIPAVPRDQLYAIPESVWDSQRESFVYETWVDRAKSAITTGAP